MIHVLHTVVYLVLVLPACSTEEPSCKFQERFQLSSLYKKGDIILGGIFEVSAKTIAPDMSFQSKPDEWKCEGFDISIFQRAQTMVFAIEEINKDPHLLRNITLGYILYDNCVKLPVSLRAATALIGGLDGVFTDYNCQGLPPVLAIVGDPTSTNSIAISRLLGVFHIPMISYYATCPCLSNKQEHPSFFRTIPSDAFQVKAMVEIIKHFRWTWIGAIASEDDYGQYAITTFSEEIRNIACISFMETIPKVNQKPKILTILNKIRQSTATAIIIFASGVDITALVKEIVLQNITGKQWIASDGWSTSSALAKKENFPSFGGTIGITIRRGEIPGLEKFLLQVKPNFDLNNQLRNKTNQVLPSKICTGTEKLEITQTAYTNVLQLRGSYNVYKAVYALAHALHNMISCENGTGPFKNNTCANVQNIQPWQLLHYLRHVNFTNHLGETVAFDENGDVLGIYDIVNWQWTAGGYVKIQTIGSFDQSSTHGKGLFLNESNIQWNFDSGKVPVSVCSNSCQPGTRKAFRKGEPICCFDCVPCADGEISNSIECIQCPRDQWSNPGRNCCLLKEVEFLSYSDAMGITLTTAALFGASFSCMVLAIFIHHRYTPVVKANNSEMSFVLLVSLTLCFLCSLCFIGQPSNFTCIIRHVVFGISFVVCVSSILVKTIVVLMAFTATLPGNNTMKWFGVMQQRCTIFFLTCVQSLICTFWLTTAPPFPTQNTLSQNAKILLECNIGSSIGFSCLLGYIGLLACICFFLAFLARNLPDTFNEAKFITFSMLIFCTVWITFIPAYISSPGKYTVAVEVFAILASSFGLLFLIFAPKCYIIILKPKSNSRKALMGRSNVTK
uniref:Extracellular calcium-sensing receptor-like n=1 Tax=Erpetoichthys calabaricus TaxID=27687 RepID=A0A8C4SEX5_ERPCA